jgi:chaperonin GroEL (HSP60 family)
MNNKKAGYDARRKVIVEDLVSESGVVDPVKVVKSALRYGAGLASILLTAECAIVDEKYDFVNRVHEHIRL